MATRTRSTLPIPDLADMGDAWRDLADAYGAFLGAVTPTMLPTERRDRHHPDRCHECGTRCQGGCHCDCCVSDTDLLVRARFGERRVVPLRIHNERQRTRQITLDLGGFRSSGGRQVPVTGQVVTATEFELEACSDREVVLVVETGGHDGMWEEALETGERARDVDDCVVAYADLRIDGCDVRPVRIAVQLLPRDCDAHEVHCACGCC